MKFSPGLLLSVWQCLSSLALLGCATDLLAGLPPPEPHPIFDKLIIAKHRIGPVSLGMTESQLLAALGDPDPPRAGISLNGFYHWQKLGLNVRVTPEGRVWTAYTEDSTYSFADGVKVGTSVLRLRSIRGAPSWLHDLDGGWSRLCFSDGTEIFISNGEVEGIHINSCNP
jgi:hypothetical protein